MIVEGELLEAGRTLDQASLDELETLWQQAKQKEKQTPPPDAIVIRKCRELDELRSCVALQKEVWNFSDAELIPLRMFVVAEKIGGQVIGAFEAIK